ncbi:unnamed protein product [Rangifer tarandus platyrhynchus]|uniref:Uncharacterized protein n=2 Tax=Rangifer tarandus platyrhynchus TaxID=3082113 RepID=A0ABN8XS46_RANTA|nr:unnamed protein product [Rangifer tarandus platyrhynchus]
MLVFSFVLDQWVGREEQLRVQMFSEGMLRPDPRPRPPHQGSPALRKARNSCEFRGCSRRASSCLYCLYARLTCPRSQMDGRIVCLYVSPLSLKKFKYSNKYKFRMYKSLGTESSLWDTHIYRYQLLKKKKGNKF